MGSCQAGNFGSACQPCPVGSYSNTVNAANCNDCPAGQYQPNIGQTSCLSCPVDTFQYSVGKGFCYSCLPGTCTDDLVGQSNCIVCTEAEFIIIGIHGCDAGSGDFKASSCPTIGGESITIDLTNALTLTDPNVKIGGTECPVQALLVENDTSYVICMLAPGVGVDLTIELIDLDDLTSTSVEDSISYLAPTITAVHGCNDFETLPDPDGTSACSRDGSGEVTVSGNNFGPDQASVLIGGVKGDLVPLSSRGLYGWEQNTTIVQVPAGSGLSVSMNVLQKGGELSDGVRMLSYKSCDPGYYNLKNDLTGIFECVECELGYYNSENEAFGCLECSIGFYCTTTYALTCDSSIPKSTSNFGSWDVDNCTCLPGLQVFGGECVCPPGEGYVGSSETCIRCSEGEYSPGWNRDACILCTDVFSTTSSTNSVSSSDCLCKPGYLDVDDNAMDIACEECRVGMVCDEIGSDLAVVLLDGGYWRESSTDLSTRECPYEPACTGSSDISNQCLEGHTGPLCAVCDELYDSGSRYSKCEKCFEGSTSTSFYVLLVLATLLCFALITFCLRTGPVAVASLKVREYLSSSSIRIKMKILLIYCQIIAQFQTILSTSYPFSYSSFISGLQVTNLDISSVLSIRCFGHQYTYYDKLIVSTLLPPCLCVVVVILFIRGSFFSGDKASQSRSRLDLSRWLLFVPYFFFPSTSRVIFEIFNCDDDFESGKSYLRADYQLECDGSAYESYLGYAILMVCVYPIGVPLLFFLVLFPYRNTIDLNPEEVVKSLQLLAKDDEGPENLDILLIDYDNVTKSAMERVENVQAFDRMKEDMEDRLKFENSSRDSKIRPFGLLYEAYRPSLWYFECVECFRRLSLTGLLVFMYPGTEKQILLAIIICILIIIFYTLVRPFMLGEHNQILLATMWGILFQLYGTLLIKLNMFKEQNYTIAVVMVIVGSAFMILPFVISAETLLWLKSIVGGEAPEVKKAKEVELMRYSMSHER